MIKVIARKDDVNDKIVYYINLVKEKYFPHRKENGSGILLFP